MINFVNNYFLKRLVLSFCIVFLSSVAHAKENYVFTAGDASLQKWLLPDVPPQPADNPLTPEKISLGKKLFFDPRLSGDGNMSCATCHNPVFGWSDALPTAKGVKSKVLGRASPTVVNSGFNAIQMWDGRKKSLEDQAMGPMEATVEMNMDTKKLFNWLNNNKGYKSEFSKAFPGEKIDANTVKKALASYERTIVSNNSAFDNWVKGKKNAMTSQQVTGFKLFVGKAKCADCHSEPNFTDDGFHNIGLPSWGNKNPDMGRYAQRPLGLMKGAFKTPTLREIDRTAPYFHDGSTNTLDDVINHYSKGGIVKTNLSPSMQKLDLSKKEKRALVAFLHALSSPYVAITLPELPR